jgi:hypothetical protein
MSSTGNTIHKPGEGETLDSLVAAYRLSSVAAILDTQSNASIRSILAKEGVLPVDLSSTYRPMLKISCVDACMS